MALQIHRSRECELTRVWEANTSSFETLQQQVQWGKVDASVVTVSDGVIELHTDASEDTKLEFSVAVGGNHTLHRLLFRTQLPQNGQTTLKVVQSGLTMVYGSSPADAASNEVFVGSSQNTSVAAELPCASDATDTFHDVRFEWDDKWLRWYVDEVLLLEEFIQGAGLEKSEGDSQVVVELSVGASGGDAKLAVERIVLDSGDSADPLCAPRYSSSSNCRPQESFAPRLGSIQGSLTVDEVEAYIDEVTSAFPLISKVDELGRSVENRPLRALCLGACYAPEDQYVPQALFTGLHHAREPISMMNLVYTIDILTNDYRNGDLAALELLSSRQLWFMLVVNPDGYAHNEMLRVWEHNEMGQRKSAAPTCDKSPRDAGVDLNRNYDVCFARDSKGSSNDPCGDDYNGPSAFSEPETQAVRDLVERNTSDFSVALNYHSYGKYFNLPFACKDEGEPTEPNNSMFMALAREMVHFNGFDYGQSWKESNLYTVNGETSDWMWQAHGIFAMSPEVGPSFDAKASPGFWPSRDDTPLLSAELHYSNLHIARMAGPKYSLAVKGVQLGAIDDSGSTSSFVSVDASVSNNGLRPASAELLGSMFVNGTSASDPIALELEAQPEGSGLATSEGVNTLLIPHYGGDFHQSMKEIQELYLVIRDAWSCHLFRVAIHFHTAAEKTNHPDFQTWSALPLPRCGTCEQFGAAASVADGVNGSIVCSDIEDVSFLEPIRTRNVVAPTTTRVGGSIVGARPGLTGSPGTAAAPNVTAIATTTLASANTTSSGSASAETASNQQSSVSSILPSSVSWSGPVAMASLAAFVLLVVAAIFFRRRRRRSKKKPARAKAASGVQKRRSNVQYSRIDEDAENSPAARGKQLNYDDEDEEIDLLDAECGERSATAGDEDIGVISKDRPQAPPRRTSRPLRSSREEIV
ncbi:hypothetical protein KRP22_014217 [Phytophthora ramorum]|nr:Carboxypeptidase T [Phytophthora ramorum]